MPIAAISNGESGLSARGKLNSLITLANAGREVLAANRVYFVRPDGNDANTGLTNTSGGAFATIPRAVAAIAACDGGGLYSGTINVADGTYTAAVTLAPLVGYTKVTITGNVTTPASCIISVSGAVDYVVGRLEPGSTWKVEGFQLVGASATFLLLAQNGTVEAGAIRFGATGFIHQGSQIFGVVLWTGNYTVFAGATIHANASNFSTVFMEGRTITFSGTPTIGSGFNTRQGFIGLNGVTWSGSFTGQRYDAVGLGLVDTNGQATTWIPGTSTVSPTSGGIYR